MSLRGRYVIDRIKNVVSKHFRLPCPPYGDPDYWEKAYTSFGPRDSYEWGDVSFSDVKEYNYHPVEWNAEQSTSHPSQVSIRSSLSESLNIDLQDPNSLEKQRQQSILMLGCGNSKLGEEMVTDGGFRGPIVQVDVSNNVVGTMRERCSELVSEGFMNFVQDDATELSAFRDGMIDACLDKGLMDAIFCSDDFHQMHKIQNTVSRVLRPGGSFVFFSFSRPEFLLPKLMMIDEASFSRLGIQKRMPWKHVEVQQLPKILLYRMQKREESDRVDSYVNKRVLKSKSNRSSKRQ